MNLNVGTMVVGTSNQTNNSVIEKYCYNDDPNICVTDGGLYQWDEMMQYSTTGGVQGICPAGWHLPTDTEWVTLEETLGMCSGTTTGSGCSDAAGWRGMDQGDQLKTAADCFGGVNCGTSGFQALLAGYRNTNISFSNRGTHAHFWSTTESGSLVWVRDLLSGEARISRSIGSKANGFSVRCVKD